MVWGWQTPRARLSVGQLAVVVCIVLANLFITLMTCEDTTLLLPSQETCTTTGYLTSQRLQWTHLPLEAWIVFRMRAVTGFVGAVSPLPAFQLISAPLRSLSSGSPSVVFSTTVIHVIHAYHSVSPGISLSNAPSTNLTTLISAPLRRPSHDPLFHQPGVPSIAYWSPHIRPLPSV